MQKNKVFSLKLMKRMLSVTLAIIMVLGILPCGTARVKAVPSVDLIWPCQNAYYVTCMYYYKSGSAHSCSTLFGRDYTKGIDIAGGGNVVAAESGTVKTYDYQWGGFGNYITISHSDGTVAK